MSANNLKFFDFEVFPEWWCVVVSDEEETYPGGVYNNKFDQETEYKIKDKMIYVSCNNKQIASAFCWFNECGDYKYCPYCGKKIKVVE